MADDSDWFAVIGCGRTAVSATVAADDDVVIVGSIRHVYGVVVRLSDVSVSSVSSAVHTNCTTRIDIYI